LVSKYVEERKKRGAPSRRRKSSAKVQDFLFLFFNGFEDLEKAKNEGWLAEFQKGMRNADGSPRREKYRVRICDNFANLSP
jgi:hypothetical protein